MLKWLVFFVTRLFTRGVVGECASNFDLDSIEFDENSLPRKYKIASETWQILNIPPL